MVYLEESANSKTASGDAPGFKTLAIEKKPQARVIKLKPFTNHVDREKRDKTATREKRAPGASMAHGRSGKKFPTRIPVIKDRQTGINGGKLKNILFFTYSHLLPLFTKGRVIHYAFIEYAV